MAEALNEVEALNFQSALASERQERVFRQIEDAVAMSMEPLDEMFRAAGLPTDQIIGQVRATYSGQGGPLMPITMSTRGEEPDAMSLRANEVLAALDELNLHRIAAEQLPFSMPVRSNCANDLGLRLPARSDQWRAAASCRDGLRRCRAARRSWPVAMVR
jgi:hypothetical protein